MHWYDVVLYFADGSGRRSRWDSVRQLAIEHDGQVESFSDDITQEHLRALSELRDQGSCANWLTDEALAGDGPGPDSIDWDGLPEQCPRCETFGPRWAMRDVPEAYEELAEGYARLCRPCVWAIVEAMGPAPPGVRLELRRTPGGPRHFLDGAPVHCGTLLEVWLEGDRWLRGRYECDLGAVVLAPRLVLYAQLPSPSPEAVRFARDVLEDDPPTIVPIGELALHADARLRWPAKGYPGGNDEEDGESRAPREG